MTEAAAAVEARFPGTRVNAFGHLGDGNVHFNVRAPGRRRRRMGRGGRRGGHRPIVHDLVTAAGGSISAEHGIGQMKLAELARLGDPARLGALRAIKRALDPTGIMNPGKLVPPVDGAQESLAQNPRSPIEGCAEIPRPPRRRSHTAWRFDHGDSAAAHQFAALLQEFAAALEHAPRQAQGAEPTDKAPYLAKANAIPLTIDEFITAQRHLSRSSSRPARMPVPLALMGLNEGVNVFVDDEGKPLNPVYIPAYVRRYPYLLARLDPSSRGAVALLRSRPATWSARSDEGQPLFDGDKPSETLNGILKFCEEFEIAAQRTNAFMKELRGARTC